jgi:Rps23 Pro-64 3,4-dihydroxylase Tpa1-like proline 4-hydroxylase
MEIKNFVKIYDEVLPWENISSLIKFSSNSSEFQKAYVGGSANFKAEVNFNVRRTWTLGLSNIGDSLTKVHWFNFLTYQFDLYLKKYIKDLNIGQLIYQTIVDISVLKYENTGFYTWHTDHFAQNPRTMSCILLLNNDYEGGNLCFRDPNGSGEWEVEVKPNRMIIWPSCFMYPHTVKPVTKGTRYSVVAWAL